MADGQTSFYGHGKKDFLAKSTEMVNLNRYWFCAWQLEG
jgi:hypothetical protein